MEIVDHPGNGFCLEPLKEAMTMCAAGQPIRQTPVSRMSQFSPLYLLFLTTRV